MSDRLKMTLSQIGLSIRFECDPSTVRRQGEKVTGYARDRRGGGAHREIWKRLNYGNGRLAGYERIATSERGWRSPSRKKLKEWVEVQGGGSHAGRDC